MKTTIIQSIKLALFLLVIINTNLFSQDLEEKITDLLHQNYSSSLIIPRPLCQVDRIKDYYLPDGTDDTIEQLAGCSIFFAWDSVTDKSNIGIYGDSSILWLSEPLDFYRGGIAALKDINKDNKIEIVTVWASGSWDQVWIFRWVDETGVILNESEDGYSNVSGHEGTIMIEDIDGDGLYEITGSAWQTDYKTGEGREYEFIYKWNGSKYVSLED